MPTSISCPDASRGTRSPCSRNSKKQSSCAKISPSYGEHLTQQQIAQRFGPIDGAAAIVGDWLQEAGVQAFSVAATGDMIDATMPAPVAETLFETEIHHFRHATTGHTVNRAVRSYSLPSAVAADGQLKTTCRRSHRRPPRTPARRRAARFHAKPNRVAHGPGSPRGLEARVERDASVSKKRSASVREARDERAPTPGGGVGGLGRRARDGGGAGIGDESGAFDGGTRRAGARERWAGPHGV